MYSNIQTKYLSGLLGLWLIFACLACTSQSTIRLPPLTISPEPATNCEAVFPLGKWQLVHAIEFTMAGGKKGTAIGVSVLDAPVIKSALMTVEGFVLFEATLDGEVEITRAVPPFDNLEFAKGLMRDLQLIFFRPASNKMQYGQFEDGTAICRYHEVSGESTDVALLADHGWEIHHYDANHRRTRTVVKADPIFSPNMANQWQPMKRLELQADDMIKYHLKMDLISAEEL